MNLIGLTIVLSSIQIKHCGWAWRYNDDENEKFPPEYHGLPGKIQEIGGRSRVSFIIRGWTECFSLFKAKWRATAWTRLWDSPAASQRSTRPAGSPATVPSGCVSAAEGGLAFALLRPARIQWLSEAPRTQPLSCVPGWCWWKLLSPKPYPRLRHLLRPFLCLILHPSFPFLSQILISRKYFTLQTPSQRLRSVSSAWPLVPRVMRESRW